jgi:hypothetical protein
MVFNRKKKDGKEKGKGEKLLKYIQFYMQRK